MTATLKGEAVGTFLPTFLGQPSDANSVGAAPLRDTFLSRKGVDTRRSACQYYLAVGAVAGCDLNGNLIGAMNFEDWKRATHMEPYTRGGKREVKATFINRMDLNLAREHHSISYGAMPRRRTSVTTWAPHLAQVNSR
jgi:hypothetical protein